MNNKATGTSTKPELSPSVAKVLAALHRLGEATAAATAADAGLGYSTTTPKLRTLENAGLAEPIRKDDGRTLWRLTDTGREHPASGSEQASGIEPARTDSDATDATSAAAEDDPQQPGGSAARDDTGGPGAPVEAHVEGPQRPAPAGAEASSERTDEDHEVVGAPVDGEPAAAEPPAESAAAAAESVASKGDRRASGTLRGAILDILEANPAQQYKVSELCKLIDQANEGTGAKKASAGAVNNAAVKLVEAGTAVLTVEKPATFALAASNT